MNRAIIIGGGVDALVAAQVLARAGREVMVIESESFAANDGWVPPWVLSELRIEGLNLEWPDPWLVVPLPDGGRLELWRDMARSAESIRRLSPGDAECWPAFCERMARLARFLEAVYGAAPPDPLSPWFALRARRLGRQGLADLLRLLPMPVGDLLDDWFETDALKGALGAAGILHLLQGPRSGGTALRLLHHHVGCAPGIFRPPRSNIVELLGRLPRVELRGTEVLRIVVRNGAVAGVVLKDGRELAAPVVVSSADPRRSLLELVEPGWLDPELARAQPLITETLKLEETRFRKTLENGLGLLSEASAGLEKGDVFGGDVAFKLYDTYGFPVDLTQDALKPRGISVDMPAFDAAMQKQKDEARKAWKGSGEAATEGVWFEIKDEAGASEFLGYETETAEGQVRAVVKGGRVVVRDGARLAPGGRRAS